MKRLLHTLLLLLATLPAAAQLSDRPAEIRREVLSVALPAPDRSMRPVVGISVNEQARNSVRSTYTEAIEQAGGLPVIIPMSQNTDVLAEQLSRIDALVLIGGDDITRHSGTSRTTSVWAIWTRCAMSTTCGWYTLPRD